MKSMNSLIKSYFYNCTLTWWEHRESFSSPHHRPTAGSVNWQILLLLEHFITLRLEDRSHLVLPHCLPYYFNSLHVYVLQHVLDHSAQMYQAAVVTSGPPQSTIPLVMFGDKSYRSGSCCFVSQASCQTHKISLIHCHWKMDVWIHV